MECCQGKSCHGLRKKERLVVYGRITVSEGVTILVQKINKVWFTKSRGQKRAVFTREKPRATNQIQDERAWKGSGRPVRGTCVSGSTGCASTKVPRRQWVRRTIIPAIETSPKYFLLNMESVCSQVVSGSGSSCKWESVGT